MGKIDDLFFLERKKQKKIGIRYKNKHYKIIYKIDIKKPIIIKIAMGFSIAYTFLKTTNLPMKEHPSYYKDQIF